MEKLNALIKENPYSDTAFLEYTELDDLSLLMPGLSALPNLKKLYLYGNKLTALPADMSALKMVETLDISNNPFEDVRSLFSQYCLSEVS